eukprot:5064133-Prymnesium_polylepis.2
MSQNASLWIGSIKTIVAAAKGSAAHDERSEQRPVESAMDDASSAAESQWDMVGRPSSLICASWSVLRHQLPEMEERARSCSLFMPLGSPRTQSGRAPNGGCR